jgi:anti-sigma28 factor (negative regulator of flagellin synthesis)
MIISRAEIESVVSAKRAQAKKKRLRVDSIAYDTIDSYEATRETSGLAGMAAEVTSNPFYRTSLVADLERRISEGRYYVPADQIVEKLIGRLAAEAIPS